MSSDAVELFRDCLIQHGPLNDRIYLMQAPAAIPEALPGELVALARERGYSKIFARVPFGSVESFRSEGFVMEACVPCFYPGGEAAAFLGHYLRAHRAREKNRKEIERILESVLSLTPQESLPPLPARFQLRRCRDEDIPGLADLYRRVFASYPFPIQDSAYLSANLGEKADYFIAGAADGSGPVAASSAERVKGADAVEMTDFATLPSWRGHGFARHLLKKMEETVRKARVKTAFTIARALSPGMNAVFARAGYSFAGRLKNNTQIAGRLESMNVWHKSLSG